MFGLGSFWPWMASKSRCVIKAIYYLDKKATRCQSFCLLFLLIRKSRVADRAKPKPETPTCHNERRRANIKQNQQKTNNKTGIPTEDNGNEKSQTKNLNHLRTFQHIIHIHIFSDFKIIRKRTIFHTT